MISTSSQITRLYEIPWGLGLSEAYLESYDKLFFRQTVTEVFARF